jgi:hypothetical protein
MSENYTDTERRAARLARAISGDPDGLTALCDDGTIWRYRGEGWSQLPPIPSDPRLSLTEAPAEPVMRPEDGAPYYERGYSAGYARACEVVGARRGYSQSEIVDALSMNRPNGVTVRIPAQETCETWTLTRDGTAIVVAQPKETIRASVYTLSGEIFARLLGPDDRCELLITRKGEN